MVRPAFVKLGGSVLTDKEKEGTLRRAQARRLLTEIARSDVPSVVFHGAGSYGHPPARRAGLGTGGVRDTKRVTETLASVALLHGEVLDLASTAGLHPVSVPLHLGSRSEAGSLVDLPVNTIQRLLDDGCTPVLSGTLVEDDAQGWRVASADELLVTLAADLTPRMALFVTDVDGMFDMPPDEEGARLLPRVTPDTVAAWGEGPSDDVTGRMAGKVARAFQAASICPVLVANGTVRGRVLDVLKGKEVPCTRIETT